MPGYDKTGPQGDGPITGGGFGFCNTGRDRFGAGSNAGYGRGGGRGRRLGGGRSQQGAGMRRGMGQRNNYGPDSDLLSVGGRDGARIYDLARQNEELKARVAELEKISGDNQNERTS